MKKITLLIADDHDMFRQGLLSLLSGNQHLDIIAQASNGTEALELIQQHKPDVAILDMTMPGLSGVELCRIVKQQGLSTRTIILTMHDDLLLAQEVMQSGSYGFVLKDNTFDEVVTAIECAYKSEGYMSPSIQARMDQGEDKISPLSFREQEVLRMLAEGVTVKVIASKLDVSTKSIDTYRQRLMRKLGAENSAHLIQYAVKRSLV
jgi:two-component system nitrate/nitrite response regulator NarL